MMNTSRHHDDVFHGLSSALMVLDRATLQILYANEAAEQFTGCSAPTLAERTLGDFFLPDERARLEQALLHLRDGQVRRLRETVKAAGGIAIAVEITAHPARLNGSSALIIDLRLADDGTSDAPPASGKEFRRDALLQGVANATNRLMQPGSYDRTVREALAIIGEASDTDCVAVFQVVASPEEQDTLFVRQQRWSRNGDESQPVDFPQQFAVHQCGLEGFFARLERYETVHGTPDTLPELHALFEQVTARSLIIAPIFIDVSLWGFIGLCDFHAGRLWLREESSALQTLAASIGAANQREQIEQKLRHERAVADTLREMGAVLTSTLDLDEMLARLLNQAQRIVPFDSANVMLINDGVARIVHCIGHDAFGVSVEDVCTVQFPLSQSSYIRYLVTHRTPLVVPDVRHSAVWKDTPGSRHVRSWLGVPILVLGEAVGLFALDSVTPHYFNDQHVRMLLPFAQQAGIAFENVRLYEQQRAQAIELAARLDQVDALYNASQSILSSLDLDVILQRFAEQMTRLTRSTSAAICNFDPAARTGVVQAVWPEVAHEDGCFWQRGDRLDFNSPLLEPVIEQHEVVRYTADQVREAFGDARGLETTHELVVVPVFSRARPLGVALLLDDPAHRFALADLQTCRALASQAAIAFEQALLFSEVRELERVKSEMIRLASHDLRSPLTRLQAYLDVIERRFETLSPERRARFLHQAAEAAGQMQHIISDLLSLERIEQQHRLAQPIVWSDLIAQAVESVQADLAESRCTLVVDAPAPLPDGRGDPVRLERALSNLIANAIKYSPDGGQIVVRARQKEYGAEKCVSIEVEDRGIGISPDEQGQLFEPFYRVETAADDFPGFGLGLAVVKAAVSYHNGRVYVDSEPGQGSLFGFRIPV